MPTLAQALRLSTSSCVAFVGAGGKTTALFQAARSIQPHPLSKAKGTALATTTTHLGEWQVALADRHFVWTDGSPLPDLEAHIGAGITLITGALAGDSHRYGGLSTAQMEKLRQLAGYHDLPLLVEADGARQKPLKAPAEHEPVIPGFVDTVVVVAGLAGLNQPLSEGSVHRAQWFGRLGGLELGEKITAESLVRALTQPQGGLKNIPAGARRIVLLNQADSAELQAAGQGMAGQLLKAYQTVIVTALADAGRWTMDDGSQPIDQRPPSIFAVHENIAGIILAAGASSRFGQPKQLLDYHGQPFVRMVAETALAAGLSPVVVVTGANAEAVEAALEGLPIVATRNSGWKNGQSTSIQAGINALTRPRPNPAFGHHPFSASPGKWVVVGGAIFLLADQPQVTVEVIRALVERHAQELPAVLAPYVFDQRANPVLFDRVTFADLLKLEGDSGGRAIFSKFSPRYLNWYDKKLLLDVDTVEDYQRLVSGE